MDVLDGGGAVRGRSLEEGHVDPVPVGMVGVVNTDFSVIVVKTRLQSSFLPLAEDHKED